MKSPVKHFRVLVKHKRCSTLEVSLGVVCCESAVANVVILRNKSNDAARYEAHQSGGEVLLSPRAAVGVIPATVRISG